MTCAACSPSPSGMRRKQACFWPATPSASSRCTIADDGWTLRVASQVKALLAGGGSTPRPNRPACRLLPVRLRARAVHAVPGIRALPAGHYLWADERGAGRRNRFSRIAEHAWRRHASNRRAPQGTRTKALRSTAGIRARPPGGRCAGGGLSLRRHRFGRCCCAAARWRRLAANVTLAFDEYLRQHQRRGPAGRASGPAVRHAPHHRRSGQRRTSSRASRRTPGRHGPAQHRRHQQLVRRKAAAEQGLKVALSGLGGDELFGGYPSFRRATIRACAAPWRRCRAWQRRCAGPEQRPAEPHHLAQRRRNAGVRRHAGRRLPAATRCSCPGNWARLLRC